MAANTLIARAFRRLAARPVVAGSLVAGVALLCAAGASAGHGFPLPAVHDEYSYRLGAETFASGRLTNPPHPMWRYFDTFHVLQQPTYTSKYPPANALFIAGGWLVTGRPIGGVWLSFAFMCVAIWWMLRAWIGPGLGLGVTLAFGSWAALSYWSYTYWGGAVAAGAGALVFGGLHRIVRGHGRSGSAVVLGAGLLLLANSRPYEGLLLSLPVAAVLVRWLWRDRHSNWRRNARGVIVPLVLVGGAGLSGMGIYNHAVTGKWNEMPYTAYERAHPGPPLFIWQQPRRLPAVADPTIRAFIAWEDTTYQLARTFSGRTEYATTFVTDFIGLVLPLALALPFLLVPLAIRDQWIRFALVAIAWSVIGMGLTAYFNPHYAAPLVGLVLVVYGGCLRWLGRLRIAHRPVGGALAMVIVALWLAAGAARTGYDLVNLARTSPSAVIAGGTPEQRQLIADTLSRGGRRNLVIVRYGDSHSFFDEWVYNAANIDASPVVWARDMGDPGNQPLLDYFRDRAVWVIDVNGETGPFPVRPYASRTP